jgi:hypothetical protein
LSMGINGYVLLRETYHTIIFCPARQKVQEYRWYGEHF